jgi:hypothetical protein
MLTLTENNLKKLYEIDDYQWLLKTIELLKNRQLKELDIDNLIEELIALSKREKRRVNSLLEQIIIHLLLYQYWTEESLNNANHWRGEISVFRNQLNDDLSTNLKQELKNNLESLYQRALRVVKSKSGLNSFPENCPYSLIKLLDYNWYPNIRK